MSQKVTRVTSYYLYYSTCLKCPLPARTQAWTLMPLANSIFNNARPRAAHSLLMRHFTSSTCDLKMNTFSVKRVVDFQWVCGLGGFWSCMRYPA